MKIALLSSYTADFLKDKLKSLLDSKFGKTEIYLTPFNQYTQEILNKESKLYSFLPDIIIFLADDDVWLKNQQQIIRLLQKANQKLPRAIFLIGNIIQSNSHILPSLQWNIKNSLSEQIASGNLKLARFCQTHKNFYIVNVNDLVQLHGRLVMFDPRMLYLTKNPWSQLGIDTLSKQLVQQIDVIMGKRKKVIGLDLDNTLWGGILGEDEFENILLSNDGLGKAYYDFQQSLLKLRESGILLTICSKNDEKLIFEFMVSHPYMLIKKHHLSAWRINWNNKVDNLTSIANELNLGLDSFVFLDDSPFEREFIKASLLQIEVPNLPSDPSEYKEFLAKLSSFDASIITEEDKKRNEMYQHERIRNSQQLSSASLEKFLHSLKINVSVQRSSDFNLPRVAQLTQRTNQFNLTNKRYNEHDIRKLNKDRNNIILTVSSKDRIGDMGLVGVIIASKALHALVIDNFLMSCRVLGRGIEEAALFALVEYGYKFGVDQLIGEFIPSNKNDMAKDFYSKNHFDSEQDGLFEYDFKKKKIKKPSWITLNL